MLMHLNEPTLNQKHDLIIVFLGEEILVPGPHPTSIRFLEIIALKFQQDLTQSI